MCYTTVTHFNRCAHRTSTTTFCPRSIPLLRPTVYHPPTRHPQSCRINGREGNILVQREELCGACRRASSWYAGGGGYDSRVHHGSRRGRDKAPAAQTAGVPPHQHFDTEGRWPPGGPSGSAYPVPTGAAGGGRCPLSEAFERVVRIGDDEDARVGGSRRVPGGVGEGVGMDGSSRNRRHRGEYGPFRPPHFSSDADNGAGGLPGGHGGHGGRKARRTAGKKQVRFAPKVEVLYFRRDWATRTLRSLSREYKARR